MAVTLLGLPAVSAAWIWALRAAIARRHANVTFIRGFIVLSFLFDVSFLVKGKYSGAQG
jgi:hypothetical protein